MRCDEMISSRHRSDRQVDILVGLVGHDEWKTNLWTQKSGQTPAGWTGKVLPAAAAYYIREVQEECKRKSWPSEEEEEEAWSPHDYGSTDGGEDMVESFRQLMVYINISICSSNLKLKLISKIQSAAEYMFS